MALEAEEYVLGAMMLSPAAIESCGSIVGPGDFYRESHARIWDAIHSLYAEGGAVDAITVVARLEREGVLKDVGGPERIREIATLAPVSTNAPHHARVVKEAAVRRALIAAGNAVAGLGWEPQGPMPEMMNQAEAAVFELSQHHGRTGADLAPASEIVREVFTVMETLIAQGGDIIGLPTGFHDVDRLTSGLKPGQLVLVGGRPSMGKSAFALGAATNIVLADEPVPVAMFSLEMTKLEVIQRILSGRANVDSQNVQNPWRLNRDEYERVTMIGARLDVAPLWVDETQTTNMMDIRSKARRQKLRTPNLGLIVVDYVQLMVSGVRSENRNSELSQISRAFKMLAVELQVPIILVSQLSRQVEDRHDKRPLMSDLRDSGSLEQDADMVILLYRDEYYFPDEIETRGIAECNVAKNRNGPVGMRKLAFIDRYAKFSDLARDTP
jgi:replicative DNA helicase